MQVTGLLSAHRCALLCYSMNYSNDYSQAEREKDLMDTAAAIARAYRNGTVAFGHDSFDRYAEGYFNALAALAGMLGLEPERRLGYQLGAMYGTERYQQVIAVYGESETWPENQ